MRASGSIEIGGGLDPATVRALAEAAFFSNARGEWNGPLLTPEGAERHVLEAGQEGTTAWFCGEDVIGGRLTELERVAGALGLPYRVVVEGDNPGADAEPCEEFHPGWGPHGVRPGDALPVVTLVQGPEPVPHEMSGP